MTVDELRQLKKNLGYSNKRVSELSGIPLGTINKVFSGASANPRIDTLNKISDALLSVIDGQKKINNDPLTSTPSVSLIREGVTDYYLSSTKKKNSIREYYRLPNDHRVELFEGTFFDMASPSVIHQRIVKSLCFQLEMFIRSNKGSCELFPSPVDVQPDSNDDQTMLQPDVLIVCDSTKITRKGIVGAPDFIAEIVSPSSIKMDYYRKSYKYEASGVREYWIIDPEKKTVLINRFELNEPPLLIPLTGYAEVAIYDGKLKINLDEFAECITD